MDNLLTRMEKPGTVRVPHELRREALATHLMTLKAQGHAIMADEVEGELIVYHYLSCEACKKGVL